MKKKKSRKTTPEQFAHTVVEKLLNIARANEPQVFKGYLMGGIMANVLGNLPDDYWQEFAKCDPCDSAMCNCHLLAAQVMPALEAIRNDHNENCPRQLSA